MIEILKKTHKKIIDNFDNIECDCGKKMEYICKRIHIRERENNPIYISSLINFYCECSPEKIKQSINLRINQEKLKNDC